MLQNRIAWRSLQNSCKCFSSILPRTYATVVQSQPSAPEPSVDPTLSFAPPPTRDKGVLELRTYKPRTPGTRHLRRPVNDHLWKGRPVKELTVAKKGQGKGGRNCTGHVTVRHRGGGHKRRIRLVDFERKEPGQHVVERIEHDPNRNAHIALLRSKMTKKQSYIIAAEGMREGDIVQSYRSGIPKDLWESMGGVLDPGILAAKTAWRGNCLPLHMIPIGTLIYNVGLHKGKGAQLCRSAGTFATVVAKAIEGFDPEADEIKDETGEIKKLTFEDKHRLKKLSEHVTLRLKSGEIRLIHKDCCATIGVASNANHQYTRLGKAGRNRWLGIRPTVRGVAMNAMDHPHGGGRGKSKGNVHPKSPWGLPVCTLAGLCRTLHMLIF